MKPVSNTLRVGSGLQSGADGFMLAIADLKVGALETGNTSFSRGGGSERTIRTKPLTFKPAPRECFTSSGYGRTPDETKSRPAAWKKRAAPSNQRTPDSVQVLATNRVMQKEAGSARYSGPGSRMNLEKEMLTVGRSEHG